MKTKGRRNRGFIKAIVTIALAFVVLKFAFHIDPLDLLRHPAVEPYFQNLYAWIVATWQAYLLPAVYWCWARLQDGWELARTLTAMLMDMVTTGYGKAEIYNPS